MEAYPFACGGAGSGEHACGEVTGGKGAGGVEDVLVDGGAAVHLVRGDEPFVTAGEDVVGKFSAVGPPAVAVVSETEEAALLKRAQALVLLRGEVSVTREGAPVDKGVHTRSSLARWQGRCRP